MSAAISFFGNEESVLLKKSKSYRINLKNQDEIFSYGKTFYKEFSKGVKHFGFSSVGYKCSQQRALLGVACYFRQVQGLKTGIITDNLSGLFRSIITKSVEVEFESQEGFVISCYQIDGMYIFDLNALMAVAQKEKISFEKVLEVIQNVTDVNFFDVPDLERVKTELSVFKPILKLLDSLSVVFFENNSENLVDEVHNYFNQNGIDLRGGLMQLP